MKVRQRLRRACVRHYTGKGWRDRGAREGRMERETDTERERERGTKERETRWPRSREGGWYVWAGSSQGGSGSAAGGEIMGADEPESKH